MQTSVLCAAGLAVFAFSEFAPASRFARIMSVLIGLAHFGDVIILPALLINPLGKSFETTPLREDRVSTAGRSGRAKTIAKTKQFARNASS